MTCVAKRFSKTLSLALALASCSSSSDPPKACTPYEVPAGTDLQNPKVGFKTDVLPILVLSCAFSSCHGAPGGRNNGVYLGSKTTSNDASAIRKGLVDVVAPEHASMKLTAPGDPGASYLMHKLDGDQCRFAKDCNVEGCGEQMPHDSDPLDIATRDTIRRWITQGAPE